MVAEEVADARDRRAERTDVTYGNMRVKLSDYIGQVFECKAAWGKRREANGKGQEKRKIVDGVYFSPLAPCPSPLALPGQCSTQVMRHAINGPLAQTLHEASVVVHSLTSPTPSHSIGTCHASKSAKP